jgi:hypothetical protein
MAIVRRQWGNNTPSKGSTNNDKWSLTIKSARYTDGGDLCFKLGGLKNDDVNQINQINPTVFCIKKGQDKSNWLVILKDKYDEFIADTSALENFLKSSNNYQEASLTSFFDKIESFADSTPTQEDIDNNNKAISSNWRELLQTLNDPEVRKKFLAFQTTYTCMTNFKDAVLSPANVTSVLMADPQATFVTDKKTWESKFNRKVQDGAPFVIITKVENTLPPFNLLNNDPEVKRAGGWNEVVKKSGGVWYGAAYAAIKRVRLNNNLKPSFYKSKVYDVRYTTPMNPSKDLFMDIANLVNNLTGEINLAAKQMLDQEAAKNGQNPMDYDAKREGITNNKELTAFKDFILKKCKIANINVSTVGSDEDIIANAVYEYAYQKAESLNKLHDKVKSAFANAVCLAIAATFNIKSNRTSNAVSQIQQLTPNDVETIAMDSFEIYKTLANFSLRESSMGDGHVMSFDEFSDFLLSKTKNKNNIKAQFDDMTSRMDALEK